MHTETSFDLLVRLPYAETAVLFGPEGERAWAGPGWNPQFLYLKPGRDTESAVFTVNYGPLFALWVVARHDLDARHFCYVYFIADVLVTTVDVRFEPLEDHRTRVNVMYRRTALTPAGEAQVEAMTEEDKRAGNEWQEAIDNYLALRASLDRA
jgi:hypothetical protein